MGTPGLTLATVQGGQLPDSYLLIPNYYMEGILKGHWDTHKVTDTELTNFSQVEEFVSFINLYIYIYMH
jgi:hypothetical protein